MITGINYKHWNSVCIGQAGIGIFRTRWREFLIEHLKVCRGENLRKVNTEVEASNPYFFKISSRVSIGISSHDKINRIIEIRNPSFF